ncbi:MAG: DMT family transporter [Planctomycetes bacterium]|nr:DMT family transporter [Planctomycetota bacterium]
MPSSLLVLLAGALFATGGALIKSCDFPSLQRAGLRAAVAAATVFALLPAARRRPGRGTLLLVLPYFGATCCFVVANTLTTAANAIFLQATAPAWVALLGPLLLHESPRRRELLTMAGIAVGMALCFAAPATALATAPSPRLGDLFGLLSGLSFGLLLLGMRWLSRRGEHEAPAAIAWGNTCAAPLALLLMPLVGQTPVAGSASDWLVILILGTCQVGLAYVLLVRAAPEVSALRASLLLMVEPALNPILAFAVHGERPHWLTIAGGTLILASVASGALLRPRFSRGSAP